MTDEAHATSPSQRWLVVAGLSAIIAAGLAIRFYHLGARSFWFDEAFSWKLTTFSWTEMLERASRDNNPPLYYVLLKAWSAVFGESAVALRSLSVLMGGVTIAAAYLFCAEAFGRDKLDDGIRRGASGPEIGLVAAALVAVSVYQIRWAWEARMYTLGAALALLSGWLLLRALRINSWVAWGAYALTAVLFLYTHTYALFSIAGQILFLAGHLGFGSPQLGSRKQTGVRAVLALALVAVCWSPWLPILLWQHDRVVTDFWSQPLNFNYVERAFYEMFVVPEDPSNWTTAGHVALAAIVALLVILMRRRRPGHWLVLCGAVVPIWLSVNISLMTRNIFHVRYLIFAHVYLLLALSVVIGRVPHAAERRMIATWVIAAGLSVYVWFWQRLDILQKPGGQSAVAQLEAHRNAGEPVIVCSPLLYYSLVFHAGDRSNWRLYDDGAQPYIHYYGSAILDESDLVTQPVLSKLTASSLWVAEMEGGGWGTHRVPLESVRWKLDEEHRYPEVYGVQGTIVLRRYSAARKLISSQE